MSRYRVRHWLPLVVISWFGIGCMSADASPDAIITGYSIDVEEIERRLKRVDTAYDMVIERLRPDSGTARADSLFVQLEREIADTLRAAIDTVNTDALQLMIWRDGAVGQRVAREGNHMVDAQGTRTSLIDYLTAEDGSRGRSTEEQLLDLFKRNGVHVNRAEGDSYFWIDQSRLAAAVYPYVTDATRDHMRLVALEQREPFTEHEVITIPLDSLAARLTLVDEMIVRHDSTIIAPKLRDMRSGYIAGYLTGFANSSVFDDSGELRPDVRSSFERFVAGNPRTYSGSIVARYLELLRAAGFRKSATLDAFRYDVQ